MKKSALAGVRVVEYATMVSGPYCGKLLADLGADVVKVEPPGGDPARRAGPFPKSGPHGEQSGLFLYNNTSKRGVVLDLDDAGDREDFRALLSTADVLIDNHSPSRLHDLGLGWQALQALNPRLVYTSITPYGRTGPRAHYRGDELTLIHAGGLGNLLPTRSVDVSRAPVKMGGRAVGYHGGLVAALATLGALLGRRGSGVGELVEISLQEVVLALVSPVVASTRYHQTTWSRVPDRPPAMGRMKVEDGYVILNAFDDHHFRALRELMGNPDWCADDRWDLMAYRIHHLMDIAPHIDQWMLSQKKNDLHHRAAQRGIPIGPINTARDVMENPQYAARGYFVEVEHPEVGRHRYAGWPYRMSVTPPRVSRPAPLLDEHRSEVLAGGRGSGTTGARAPSQPGRDQESLPLAGIRVMEFCWVWAGPYAGRLLASLGAEVIKIEGPKRPDLTRRSVVWPLHEPTPTTVAPNQGLSFNSVNLNKMGITLDLRQAQGVELALRLATHCDVVVDNMRPGALARLGLGYEDFRKVRDDLIVASSSGRGSQGPESNYLGYAMVHHGVGGGAYITGYPDEDPAHSLGDVDLMNAMTLAYAILAALYHREQTGEGQFIDYSQCEGVSSLLGELLLGYELNGEIPERSGNQHPIFAPHNVYPAWGNDRWLALEVHSDEEFATLSRVLGQPELASDPRFATVEARKGNEAELDGILSAWTRQRDRDWMVQELCDAGLCAAPSREGRDLYADPHLRARQAFVGIAHPELGEIELVDVPWRMNGCKSPRRHAPLVGEHNVDVYQKLLGLGDEELAALRDKGVIV